MVVFAFTALLFAIAAILVWIAWRRQDGTAEAGLKEAGLDFWHLLPRLAVGVIGAGFIAKAMPQETVSAWLGPSSGAWGVALAAIAGAATPGGPVVGFAIGAAALKAGAGLPQVICYVTAWSLYTINRVLVWEVPTMPMRFVILRMLVSLPFPFLAAAITWWVI
ncbi:MAG: hypothetical protein ACRCTI_06525 [Beijerinckiaceae bacterium]